MRGKAALLAGGVITALALVPATASADHHLMKISEVYPGTAAVPDSAFVELQMYSSGQQFVAGHQVKAYNAAGAETFSVTLPTNVANGQNQRTILVGDSNADGGAFGDFFGNMGTLVAPSGGAACFISTGGFGAIDCVSWGNFSGSVPSATGTPEASAGIPNGSSLTRSKSRGCPTLLEAGDDTNNSLADFTVTASETPQTNSDPIASAQCPNTRFIKKPQRETTRRRAVFKFNATPAGAGFECKLDRRPFRECSSPFRKRVDLGKHKFKVLADDELAPARYRWKVVAED